jgi:hypothetical protein
VGASGQTARRLDDRWPRFGKRATAHRVQSSTCSHQRRQNGGMDDGLAARLRCNTKLPMREQCPKCERRRTAAMVTTPASQHRSSPRWSR